jgi:hypothetical protein
LHRKKYNRNEEEALQEALAFIQEHAAKSVAMADRIIGFPHEEGIDYPESEWCPQCPFGTVETGGPVNGNT